MKICMLSQAPQRRGAEVFADQLRGALEGLGHEVQVAYLYRDDGAHPLLARASDIRLGGDVSHPFERFPTLHPRLLREVRQLARCHDIMQLNGARTVKYGVAACAGTRAVTVYRNIGAPSFWNRSRLKQFYYRNLVFRRVDGVVSVSATTLLETQRLYGIESTPSRVIANALEVSQIECSQADADALRRTLGLSSADPLIAFCGKLSAVKRVDRWLRVVARVRRSIPNIKGCVVGDGPLRDDLETLRDELGLTDVVTFVGHSTSVGVYLRASDLLLVSSDSEGVPATVLEAAYLGTATVSTPVGGVAEVVPSEFGWVSDATDDDSLFESCLEAASDIAACRARGEAAREHARSAYTMDAVAPQYESFFREVLRR